VLIHLVPLLVAIFATQGTTKLPLDRFPAVTIQRQKPSRRILLLPGILVGLVMLQFLALMLVTPE